MRRRCRAGRRRRRTRTPARGIGAPPPGRSAGQQHTGTDHCYDPGQSRCVATSERRRDQHAAEDGGCDDQGDRRGTWMWSAIRSTATSAARAPALRCANVTCNTDPGQPHPTAFRHVEDRRAGDGDCQADSDQVEVVRQRLTGRTIRARWTCTTFDRRPQPPPAGTAHGRGRRG
jgi:hypothetical protein